MGLAYSSFGLLLAFASGVQAQALESSEPRPIEIRVPFAEGETQSVFRGPGVQTHTDRFNRHAVDFSPIDAGHLVVASTAGEVVFVKEDTQGSTGDVRDNNEVAIRIAGSRKVVVYLHLQKDGALVEVGDFVLPGDPIGRVGSTGKSEDTHLHIDVRAGHRLGPSIPWRFATRAGQRAPRQGDAVRSQNAALRSVLGPWLVLERQCELAASLGRPELVADRVEELGAALSAERLPEFLRLLEDRPDGRRLLESIRRRVQPIWARMGVSLSAEVDAATDDASRGVLALRVAELFRSDPVSTSGKCFLLEARHQQTSAARRARRNEARRFAALEKVLALEARIVARGIPGSVDRRTESQLNAAFKKAVEILPSEHRAAAIAYYDELPLRRR